MLVSHKPELVIADLTKLICRVILFTPQEYAVKFSVSVQERPEQEYVKFCVRNNAGNLVKMHQSLLLDIHQEIGISPNDGGGARFEWLLPIQEEEAFEKIAIGETVPSHEYRASPFYKKLHGHLSSHFASLENLEKAAVAKGQREGVFLQKVNAVLLANLAREGFDTEALGKALAMSRTQLYRRLNAIIGFSPSKYIWYFRLTKAKEMLEKEEVSVGEVAFRAGFQNLSHFTRAFRRQFGFNPSQAKPPTP